MRFRDRIDWLWPLRSHLRAQIAGSAIAFVLIVAMVSAVVLIVDDGAASDEPDVPVTVPAATPVPVIVPPASMADLIATPRPTPIPFPIPEEMQSDVLTVGAPLPLRIPYGDWYVVQLAFPPEEQYRAARTAWCESHFIVTARGALGEAGLFQIHPGHFGVYVDAADVVIEFADVGFLTDDERAEFWVEPHPWIAKIVDSWFPGASRSYGTILAALTDERVGVHVNAQVARYLFDVDEDWHDWSTRYGCTGWQG